MAIGGISGGILNLIIVYGASSQLVLPHNHGNPRNRAIEMLSIPNLPGNQPTMISQLPEKQNSSVHYFVYKPVLCLDRSIYVSLIGEDRYNSL